MNTVRGLSGAAPKTRQARGMGFENATRSLGMSEEALGEEGKELWAKLDAMATQQPEEYERFIAAQMALAKEAESEASPETREAGFRPTPGLCVATTYVSNSTAVFVNVCSFAGVEPPQDASGRQIATTSGAQTNLTGLSIPLAVGPLRDHVDESGRKAFVVDAVLHPWVVAQALELSAFQVQVVELALSWCETDATRGKLSRRYRRLDDAYAGFDCVAGPLDKPKTALFPVEVPPEEAKKDKNRNRKENSNTQGEQDKENAGVIGAPGDLLEALKQRSTEDAAESQLEVEGGAELDVDLAEHKSQNDSKKKKVLVQEVKKRKPAVKKGFLNNVDAKLYGDEGSCEAKPTSIYQKANIVDLSTMSDAEAKKVMEQHAGKQQPPPQQSPPAQQTPALPQAKKSQAPAQADGISDLLQSAMRDLSVGNSDDAFAKLAEAADEEYGGSNVSESAAQATDELQALLGSLAQVLPASDTTAPKSTSTSTKVAEQKKQDGKNKNKNKDEEKEEEEAAVEKPKALAKADYDVKCSEDGSTCTVVFKVPAVASIAEVDVEISESKVRLVSSRFYLDTPVKLPRSIHKDGARAKFSKKSRKLTIKAPFA